LRASTGESPAAFRRRLLLERSAYELARGESVCEPPRSFTFAGPVAHVLTWDAHRRHILIGTLRRRGIDVESIGLD
jgi:hypothetical protein